MSRIDMLSLPDSGVTQLLAIHSTAEQSGFWPIQLRHGVVHSLQKTEQASSVNDYRPITIYPFPYRVWSSLQSKHALGFVSRHAPPGLQGNRQGASTIAIWWKNQAMIESLMFDGAPAQGYVLDLTKAFNTLPREPVFRAAAFLGLDAGLLRAWMGFVVTNTRHFSIRQALSEGVQGSRGFPEGCGMSVVAMAIIDWIVDRWFHLLWPQVTFSSYVDNWELESSSVDDLARSLPTLETICSLLDLELDQGKTFGWALRPEHRAAIREAGHSTHLDGRNLGGHMQYSHRRTNYTVTAKCLQLDTLWGRLARSPATAPQKLRAARCCAWPRALHGVATVSLGAQHFQKMRAGLFRALRFRNKGAQPQLQFLMEKPNTDPEYFALEQTTLSFCKFSDPDQQTAVLEILQDHQPLKHIPGPCGVLLDRLNAIGWVWSHGLTFRTRQNTLCDLATISPQELKLWLQLDWHTTVGLRWEHRQGYAGLQNVCPWVAISSIAAFPKEHKGLLRSLLNGSFIILTHKGAELENPVCPWCSQPDSLEHRHWQCPATEQSRAALPPAAHQCLASQPSCFRLRGWPTWPKSVHDLRQALTALPDCSNHVLRPVGEWLHETIDLFTDGTVDAPRCQLTRMASWAVVASRHADHCDLEPIAWGWVPGPRQTVIRAEVWALISALRFALSSHQTEGPLRRFRLWTDNEEVWTKGSRLLDGAWSPKPGTTDCDLWNTVALLLAKVSDRVVLLKVTSHVDPTNYTCAEQFVLSGNEWADRWASYALCQMPAWIRQLSSQARQEVDLLREGTEAVRAHFVRVGLAALQVKSTHQAPPARPLRCQYEHDALDTLAFSRWLRWHSPDKLRFRGLDRIVGSSSTTFVVCMARAVHRLAVAIGIDRGLSASVRLANPRGQQPVRFPCLLQELGHVLSVLHSSLEPKVEIHPRSAFQPGLHWVDGVPPLESRSTCARRHPRFLSRQLTASHQE